jgi:hypothetical protein
LLERPDDIVYVANELRRLNADPSWRLHGIIDSDEVALVVRYATAVFRRYLKGDIAAAEALAPSGAPANVSFTSSRFP